jgi:hypothetical protein
VPVPVGTSDVFTDDELGAATEPTTADDDAVEAIYQRFENFDSSTAAREVGAKLAELGYTSHAPKHRAGSQSKAAYLRWLYKGAARTVALYQNTAALVSDRDSDREFMAAQPGADVRGAKQRVHFCSASAPAPGLSTTGRAELAQRLSGRLVRPVPPPVDLGPDQVAQGRRRLGVPTEVGTGVAVLLYHCTEAPALTHLPVHEPIAGLDYPRVQKPVQLARQRLNASPVAPTALFLRLRGRRKQQAAQHIVGCLEPDGMLRKLGVHLIVDLHATHLEHPLFEISKFLETSRTERSGQGVPARLRPTRRLPN